MTARVRVSGTLLHAPESRTLKDGGLCVTATLKAKDGERTQFWHIVAFNDPVQTELMSLSDGDAVVVQGSLKAEISDMNGEAELSLESLPRTPLACASREKNRRKRKPGCRDAVIGAGPNVFLH